MLRFSGARAIGFHPQGVECVRFGWGKVFSCGLDGTIQSWDPSEGKTWERLRSPDDLQALAANGNMLATLHAHTFEILEDKGQLAIGLSQGPLSLFDATNGRPVLTLEFEAAPFSKSTGFCSLQATHDGKFLAGTNRTYAAVWSLERGSTVWRSSGGRGGNSIGLLNEGRTLMAQQWQPQALTTDWGTGAPFERALWKGLLGNLVTSRIAPPGSAFDAVFSCVGVEEEKGTVDLSGDLEVDLDGTWDGRLDSAGRSPADETVIVPQALEPGFLLGLKLDSKSIAWKARTSGRIHDLAFRPDGQHLVCAGSGGQLELWKLGGASPTDSLDLTQAPFLKKAPAFLRADGAMTPLPWLEEDFFAPEAIHSLAISPDGNLIAAGTVSGAVVVVTLENGGK